jgi:hypothetical protein
MNLKAKPSGSVVLPSGSRPPVNWATYATSPLRNLTLHLFMATPRTAAVSAWPTAEVNPSGRESTSVNFTEVGYSSSIWREKAFNKNAGRPVFPASNDDEFIADSNADFFIVLILACLLNLGLIHASQMDFVP